MDDFKGLYCTGGALKQRIPGIIWANPLKMHGGSCGGYLVFRVAHETLGRLGIWEWDAVKKRSILVIQGGLNVSHCSKTRSSNIETYGRIDNGSTQPKNVKPALLHHFPTCTFSRIHILLGVFHTWMKKKSTFLKSKPIKIGLDFFFNWHIWTTIHTSTLHCGSFAMCWQSCEKC